MSKPRSKPTYVLGTGLSHDGSTCLLRDGEICVAIEKERITRQKHDGFGDTETILYCLEAEGITFDDVDLVVQNANFSNLDRGNKFFQGVPRIIPDSARVVTISHHLAHAYSVIGTCPFAEMGILVVDGCGSSFDDCLDLEGATPAVPPPDPDTNHLLFEKDSYYHYRDGKLSTIYKDFSPWGYFLKSYTMCPATSKHSIGGLYSAVSQYVFQGMDDPGKLMGLAPYGKLGVYPFEAFELRDGRCFVRYDWMARFERPRRRYEDLKENFQYYADIARWIQSEIERALLYLVESRFRMAPAENLGYAGGVALNAVANARILRESSFTGLYMQPAAADNGVALGCAYYGWLEVLKGERRRHSGSTLFGRAYSDGDALKALLASSHRFDYAKEDDAPAVAAKLLAEGKVVGWFEGGSEFGPRALGHRSILADPRNPAIRDFINQKIKFREDFRPFAPAVVREECARFFEGVDESPYMILVGQTRPEWRGEIPAVVHQDGSARVQTVTPEMTSGFYQVLRKFEELSGIPVLLNTSFNRRGMPIVETPEQAVELFLESALDALVLDGYVAVKRAAEEAPAATLNRAERGPWAKRLTNAPLKDLEV
ncbi:MAG: carbamoyltransferase [Acidobacteriota bacterium]|jgi:carbamoyltransferase|nr:carbamoyltransferase [Acidobacteriota bacterium]